MGAAPLLHVLMAAVGSRALKTGAVQPAAVQPLEPPPSVPYAFPGLKPENFEHATPYPFMEPVAPGLGPDDIQPHAPGGFELEHQDALRWAAHRPYDQPKHGFEGGTLHEPKALAEQPEAYQNAVKASMYYPPCQCNIPPRLASTLPPLIETTVPPPITTVVVTTTIVAEHPTTPMIQPTPAVIPWNWFATPVPSQEPRVEEVEVISNDIPLAEEVKDWNVTLEKKIAEAAGVPENRLRVVAWSWTNDTDPLRPIFEPTRGPEGCDCSGDAQNPTTPTNPPHDTKRIMAVEDYDTLADAGIAGPYRGPPGRVQMLTQDPCTVHMVRHHMDIFHIHFAHILRVPYRYVVIVPPLLIGDKPFPATTAAPTGVPPGPAPAPAPVAAPAPAPGGPAFLQVGAAGTAGDDAPPTGCNLDPPELHQENLWPSDTAKSELEFLSMESQATAGGPGPAPGPGPALGPAPAPGPAPGPAPAPKLDDNRPWVAWWSVIVVPPNNTFDARAAADELRLFVNGHGGWVAKMLPSTLARVPGMLHPGFQDRGTVPGERKLPPPEDDAIPLGFNPGGHPYAGHFGRPHGSGVLDVTERAEVGIAHGLELRKLIHDVDAQVTTAANAYRDALHDNPMSAPEVVPPMVASMGPDGVHTESPYGPWHPGEPPFGGAYNRAGPHPPEWIPSWDVAHKVGGPWALHDKIHGTPLPPGPGEEVPPVIKGLPTWVSEGTPHHPRYSFLAKRP